MSPLDEIKRDICPACSKCADHWHAYEGIRAYAPLWFQHKEKEERAHALFLSFLDEDKWLPNIGAHFPYLLGRNHIPFKFIFLGKKIRLNGRYCYVITTSHFIPFSLNFKFKSRIYKMGCLLGFASDEKSNFHLLSLCPHPLFLSHLYCMPKGLGIPIFTCLRQLDESYSMPKRKEVRSQALRS